MFSIPLRTSCFGGESLLEFSLSFVTKTYAAGISIVQEVLLRRSSHEVESWLKRVPRSTNYCANSQMSWFLLTSTCTQDCFAQETLRFRCVVDCSLKMIKERLLTEACSCTASTGSSSSCSSVMRAHSEGGDFANSSSCDGRDSASRRRFTSAVQGC